MNLLWNSLLQEVLRYPQKLAALFEQADRLNDCPVATTPTEVVFSEDNVRLLHYRPLSPKQDRHHVPVLITYALINRYIMLDLEPERSFIQSLLRAGLDVYLIDWGYSGAADRYLTMDDYISYYMDIMVDWVRREHRMEQINLLGVCMGGTFSVIYTAIHPHKINSLVTMGTPVNCDVPDGVLFLWAKTLDVDRAVDALGNMPGDIMNLLYLMAVPVATVEKYRQLLENASDTKYAQTFMRMEKWIFDSPDIAGETFRKYLKEIFQQNLLYANKFELDGRAVDLRRIACPLLNIYGEADYLVPPASAEPLAEVVGSEDVTSRRVPSGHIGMFVGRLAQSTIAPLVAEWIQAR